MTAKRMTIMNDVFNKPIMTRMKQECQRHKTSYLFECEKVLLVEREESEACKALIRPNDWGREGKARTRIAIIGFDVFLASLPAISALLLSAKKFVTVSDFVIFVRALYYFDSKETSWSSLGILLIRSKS